MTRKLPSYRCVVNDRVSQLQAPSAYPSFGGSESALYLMFPANAGYWESMHAPNNSYLCEGTYTYASEGSLSASASRVLLRAYAISAGGFSFGLTRPPIASLSRIRTLTPADKGGYDLGRNMCSIISRKLFRMATTTTPCGPD